jgi:hypothetical protein
MLYSINNNFFLSSLSLISENKVKWYTAYNIKHVKKEYLNCIVDVDSNFYLWYAWSMNLLYFGIFEVRNFYIRA